MTLAEASLQMTSNDRWRRMTSPVLVVGGLAAATIALHLRDPHQHGSWGACPLYALTGIYCPGCGGLRAVNDLSNLNIGAAASSNLLFIVLLPLLAYVFARWARGRWNGHAWKPDPVITARVTTVVMTVMVAFTVARNTPVGAWLAP